ncbi:MAG: branched-chain amino acid ABC transporter permease [Tissierellia bacterium]|nr:branched-chain amino acid ABC transporter permease [Tissierellia bacterium]MDD4726666.1 branched-chain amino acid ABC transporter permease [Tissierellia bacterium]
MKAFNKNNIIQIIILVAIIIIGNVLVSVGIIDSYIELNIVLIGINIILAVSLNLIVGFTGLFSLGHAAFMSIGAYTSAVLTRNFNSPFIFAILMSGLVASLAGILIGIPTLRLKGDYLAIATLGFGEIVRVLALNNDYIGGAIGFNDIPQYTNWNYTFIMVVLTVVLISNFVKSSHGRACISIRENEIASEAMGINTTFYKVLAFAIGAFFAGIAGSLYANYFYFIKPDSFGFMKSIDILVMVVFGGLGSIPGSIIGALSLTVISTLLQSIPDLRMVIYAVILFLIMLFRPQGIMGDTEFRLLNKKEVKHNVSSKGK